MQQRAAKRFAGGWLSPLSQQSAVRMLPGARPPGSIPKSPTAGLTPRGIRSKHRWRVQTKLVPTQGCCESERSFAGQISQCRGRKNRFENRGKVHIQRRVLGGCDTMDAQRLIKLKSVSLGVASSLKQCRLFEMQNQIHSTASSSLPTRCISQVKVCVTQFHQVKQYKGHFSDFYSSNR